MIGLAFEHHARLGLLVGDLERAEIAARQALSHNESIGYAEGAVAGLHLLGRVHAERNQVERSRAHHLQALETVLTEGGFELSDVLRVNLYVTDIPAYFAAQHIFVNRFAARGVPVAATLLGVAGLALPGLVVEVEALAAR